MHVVVVINSWYTMTYVLNLFNTTMKILDNILGK